MFGKLFKYDFRSMLKQFAFVWPAALVLALVNRFTVNSFVTSANSVKQTISGAAMLVYVAILIAMFVLAVIFIIQRFYKGLLGDEGYLMHTLPVKPWQLIGSKLLCAMVVTVVSILVAILSILLVVPFDLVDIQNAFSGIARFFREMAQDFRMDFFLFVLECVVLLLVGMAQGFLRLYSAMSIGHLFNKNRVAMSVVAYVAINTVISILMGLLGSGNVGFISGEGNMVIHATIFGIRMTIANMGDFHLYAWLSIAVQAVFTAIFSLVTNYILKNRLNLE